MMASPGKPVCQYDSKCYRKNPQHLSNFAHPGRERNVEKEDKKLKESPENPKRRRHEIKKEKSKTINDYFTKKTNDNNGHDLSESDDEGNIRQPLKKKSKANQVAEETPPSPPKTLDEPESKEAETPDCDEEEGAAPASPDDVKESIKTKFLVEMPEDFYRFWDFCKSRNASKPQDALKCVNLQLVGPFDVLRGRHRGVARNRKGKKPNFLLHYRYFYDPPEFQTVLANVHDNSQFHLGYYRDDPQEAPVFVASSLPTESPREKLVPCGENLFAAVRLHAQKLLKKSSSKNDLDLSLPASRPSISALITSLEEAASRHRLTLEASTRAMKTRQQKRVVCPTFHTAGIVVPVDANDVGYRPVPESPADLRKMLRRICEAETEAKRDEFEEGLQELITLIQFANDEADYGEGLELGLDLFSFGETMFHPHISTLLPLAYQLLNRPQFEQIITAHLEHRATDSVDQLA